MAFKVGDRIQNRGILQSGLNSNDRKFGTVVNIWMNGTVPTYSIGYDDGCTGSGEEKYYKLVSTQSYMKRLGTMLKKLVDSDTQTLLKAGYINGNLELTDLGERELFAIIFDQNKSALVAAAESDLDEETKNK